MPLITVLLVEQAVDLLPARVPLEPAGHGALLVAATGLHDDVQEPLEERVEVKAGTSSMRISTAQ
ncbi:MAG: hypothetical protein M3N32_07860 [Actinomycetota bacterium]|nr:hypothetical protein [Actinomycetota bacterium]